jgi:hypothetical protein
MKLFKANGRGSEAQRTAWSLTLRCRSTATKLHVSWCAHCGEEVLYWGSTPHKRQRALQVRCTLQL